MMGLSRKPSETQSGAKKTAQPLASALPVPPAASDGVPTATSPSGPTLYSMMIAQHHEIDQLLSRIAQAIEQVVLPSDRVGPRRLLQRLRKTLYGHISLEDGILFREFESQSGLLSDGPTATLRREHQVLKARIDALAADLDSAPVPVCRRHLEAFCALYADHCQREDVLYGICERLLSPELLAEAQSLLGRKPPRGSGAR